MFSRLFHVFVGYEFPCSIRVACAFDQRFLNIFHLHLASFESLWAPLAFLRSTLGFLRVALEPLWGTVGSLGVSFRISQELSTFFKQLGPKWGHQVPQHSNVYCLEVHPHSFEGVCAKLASSWSPVCVKGGLQQRLLHHFAWIRDMRG